MTDPGNNQNNGSQTPPPPPPPASAVTPEAAPKKKRTKQILLGAGAIIVLLIIISAVAGGGKSKSDASAPATTKAAAGASTTTAAPASTKTCKDTPNTESFDSKKQGLYPTRAGVTKTDHEAAVGDCVRISGATTYVTAATVTTDSITNKQGIIVTVSQTNRDKATKSYNALDWKLQTPQGTIENMTIIFGDNSKSLSAGELVTGGSVEGTVAFDYAGPGTYYVQYKPLLNLGSDLGVWGITVP
jgi:hypothetical protein